MAKTIRLRDFTTLQVGGVPVDYFRPRAVSALVSALAECRRRGLEWRVLGAGSNLLVDEGALPYAVIHIHAPGFDRIERTGRAGVVAGAGAPMARLLAYCRAHGLGGLEFAAGLPGTVGGAVAGNAGAWGREVCGRLERLRVVDAEGHRREIAREELRCAYRNSGLGRAVITEAAFKLEPRSPELVAALMAERARARAARQPMAAASAGCVFKNPHGQSAGKLLDLCGLKGLRAGAAQVSREHANFIVNRGGARASDVALLIDAMREAVRRKFGVELELEVRRWPGQSKVA